MPTTPIEDLPEDWQNEVRDLRRQKSNALDAVKSHRERDAEAAALLAEANKRLADMDKLKAEHEALLTANSMLELGNLRRDAAAAANLPASMAARLVGTTADELAADAKGLAESMGLVDAQGAPVPGARPSFVDTHQGSGVTGPNGQSVQSLNTGNFVADIGAALAAMSDGDSGGGDA